MKTDESIDVALLVGVITYLSIKYDIIDSKVINEALRSFLVVTASEKPQNIMPIKGESPLPSVNKQRSWWSRLLHRKE